MYPKNYYHIPWSLDFKPDKEVQAIMVPHGSYNACGSILDRIYSIVDWDRFTKIILLGTLHESFSKVILPSFSLIRFPKHRLRIDTRIRNYLMTVDGFQIDTENRFQYEPSIEAQLPYLASLCRNDCFLVPLLIGKEVSLSSVANELHKFVNNNTLIVLSTDMFHYGPEHNFVESDIRNKKKLIVEHDYRSLQGIFGNSLKKFEGVGMCGMYSTLLWIFMNQKLNLYPSLLEYYGTGDFANSKRYNFSSVSHAGVVFSKDKRDNHLDKTLGHRLLWAEIDDAITNNEKIDLLKITEGKLALIPRVTLIVFHLEVNEYRFKTISHFQVFNTVRNRFQIDKNGKKRGLAVTIYDRSEKAGSRGISLEGINREPYNVYEQVIMQTINAAMFDPKYPKSPFRSKPDYNDLFIKDRFTFRVSTVNQEKEVTTDKFWQTYKPGVHGIRLEFKNKTAQLVPEDVYVDDVIGKKTILYYDKLSFETINFRKLLDKMKLGGSWNDWLRGKVYLFKVEHHNE